MKQKISLAGLKRLRYESFKRILRYYYIGIITSLVLGGSFFGIELIFQVLTLITGLSIWLMIAYLIYNQFKEV
jgi:hypothetical protein